MEEPIKAVPISIGTPGQPVWDYMKTQIIIRYLQKND